MYKRHYPLVSSLQKAKMELNQIKVGRIFVGVLLLMSSETLKWFAVGSKNLGSE